MPVNSARQQKSTCKVHEKVEFQGKVDDEEESVKPRHRVGWHHHIRIAGKTHTHTHTHAIQLTGSFVKLVTFSQPLHLKLP